LNEQREEIERHRHTVVRHIENQDATKDDIDRILEDINTIEKQIIEQNAAESLVDIRPLVIASGLIKINWLPQKVTSFDISRLSPPYLTEYFNENCSYSGMAATGNEQHLLLYKDDALYLFDHLLRIEQQVK
jgi:hypothetical protein